MDKLLKLQIILKKILLFSRSYMVNITMICHVLFANGVRGHGAKVADDKASSPLLTLFGRRGGDGDGHGGVARVNFA